MLPAAVLLVMPHRLVPVTGANGIPAVHKAGVRAWRRLRPGSNFRPVARREAVRDLAGAGRGPAPVQPVFAIARGSVSCTNRYAPNSGLGSPRPQRATLHVALRCWISGRPARSTRSW